MNYRNHFTSRAINVVEFAQYVSRKLEQDYIGTEHILLGLLHEEGSVAFAALSAVGVTFDAVMQKVEAMVSSETDYPSDNPYYTPRAKRVMETAVEEAQSLSHNYIGTEHILLALIEETEGAATWVPILMPCRMRCWLALTVRIRKETARLRQVVARRATARVLP